MSQDPVFWTPEIFLDDPQQLNSYSYGRNNPIRYSDPGGESILDYALGFLNAFGSNQVAGSGRIDSKYYGGDKSDFSKGQVFGDLTATIIGTAQAFIGGSIAAGGTGFTISTGGVGGLVGVPATAIGGAIAGEGAAAAGQGAYNFSKNFEGGSSGNTGSKTPKEISEKISKGHAYKKHKQEFGDVSRKQFAEHAQNVMENPSEVRNLNRNRTAFWDSQSDTVVIHDPNSPDAGTMLRPSRGKAYFDNLK